MCIIVQKFVAVGQTVVKILLRYGDLSIFQNGGRPSSWIFRNRDFDRE